MKKALKTLLFFALILSLLLTSVWVFPMAGGEEPSLTIAHFNLSLESAVYIEYAVSLTGIDPARDEVKMLYWTEPKEEYTLANAASSSLILGTAEIGGETFYVFKYTGLSAKQMTDVIYARAYAKVGDAEYWSDVAEYSVVEYAARKLGLKEGYTADADENLEALLHSMLEYGASAQKYFNYKTDHLATDLFLLQVVFDSNGGSAVPTQKLAKGSKIESPAAPTKAGYVFGGWEYGGTAWNFDTPVNANMTLIAKWNKVTSQGLEFTDMGDQKVILSGLGTCSDTAVIIPETDGNGNTVSMIKKTVFGSNKTIQTIEIPNTVTEIQNSAFANLAITSIVFPIRVISSMASVCSNCSNLQTVVLPANMTSVSNKQFAACASLKSVWIPKTVTSMDATSLPLTANTTVLFEGTQEQWNAFADTFPGVSVVYNSPRPAN